MGVMPYLGYVSVLTVEHEDVEKETGLMEINLLSGERRPHVHRQGIAAAVISNVGEEVPGNLVPGNKIYFHEHGGVEIGDVTLVSAQCIIAYEEE